MMPELSVGVTVALPGLIIWLIILLLPWRPWDTRESFDPGTEIHSRPDFSRLTILIPARNEADVITDTLQAIVNESPDIRILLVDDQSTDQTVALARNIDSSSLTIFHGRPLPADWSGKLWALEQGYREVSSDYVLLLDADISLLPGTIAALIAKLENENLDFVSLMANLRMQTLWEQLLMPAFIFFFKLLYPFQLSNSGFPYVAAAAGGCILVKKQMLDKVDAFSSLKNTLIDDCALAGKIKTAGGHTWIGLTHSAISHRIYNTLESIWNMVSRTAYTQLRFSLPLLLLCSLLMCAAFIFPVLSLNPLNPLAFAMALATLGIMVFCYLPVVNYYNLAPGWIATLPLAGLLFLLMTWTSAYRYYFSKGASWKERNYSRQGD